jgi:hypothetical protein
MQSSRKERRVIYLSDQGASYLNDIKLSLPEYVDRI